MPLKHKGGSKLPHWNRSFIQCQLYQGIEKSQGKVWQTVGKATGAGDVKEKGIVEQTITLFRLG